MLAEALPKKIQCGRYVYDSADHSSEFLSESVENGAEEALSEGSELVSAGGV